MERLRGAPERSKLGRLESCVSVKSRGNWPRGPDISISEIVIWALLARLSRLYPDLRTRRDSTSEQAKRPPVILRRDREGVARGLSVSDGREGGGKALLWPREAETRAYL